MPLSLESHAQPQFAKEHSSAGMTPPIEFAATGEGKVVLLTVTAAAAAAPPLANKITTAQSARTRDLKTFVSQLASEQVFLSPLLGAQVLVFHAKTFVRPLGDERH